VTLVAVLAAGVTVYSAAYGVLAVRAGQDDRLADGVFHLALGAGALVAALGAFRPGGGSSERSGAGRVQQVSACHPGFHNKSAYR